MAKNDKKENKTLDEAADVLSVLEHNLGWETMKDCFRLSPDALGLMLIGAHFVRHLDRETLDKETELAHKMLSAVVYRMEREVMENDGYEIID